MNIKIYVPCKDCDGLGQTYSRVSETRCVSNNCPHCDDEGFVMYEEEYDSVSDALEDYPHAIRFSYSDVDAVEITENNFNYND